MTFDLHAAATNGTLHELPDEALTLDALLVRDFDGRTPLLCAAFAGLLDKVPVSVLQHRLVWEVPNCEGESPLFWAAERKQLEFVPRSILSNRELWRMAHRKSLETPFHRAAAMGSELIGIPPTIRGDAALWMIPNSQGMTPLHLAAMGKHLDKVPNSLRTHPITWIMMDGEGRTPADLAGTTDQIEFLPLHLRPKAKLSATSLRLMDTFAATYVKLVD